MADRFLPLVQHEIVDSLLQELKRDPEYREKFLVHLRKENPEIALFLDLLVEGDIPKPFLFLVISSGIMVYKMLESQAQADVMKKQFNV